MVGELVYNKNPYMVTNEAFDMIPNLKDGKSDAGAIVSYVKDIQIYKRFKDKYLWHVGEKDIRKKLIERWNLFCKMRNDEDYKPHRDTSNYEFYDVIFSNYDNLEGQYIDKETL